VLADVLDRALSLLIGDAQILVAGVGHSEQSTAPKAPSRDQRMIPVWPSE